MDVEEALADGDYESIEKIEEDWKYSYPNDIKLFNLAAIEDPAVNFKGIFFGEHLLVSYFTDKPFDEYHEYSEWIDGLNEAAENAVALLKNGEYETYLEKYIDPADRTGTLPIRTYWEYYPDDRKEFYETLDDDKISRFMKESLKDEDSIGRMDRMNAETFYHACAIGYKASGHDCPGLSEKELYYRKADGRDEGMRDLDPASFEAFDAWYFDRNRWGGHPWEIVRGGNSTHIDLFVCHNDRGWYFEMAGSSLWCSAEAINIYLALIDAGYPATICDAQLLRSRLDGSELIGIVPYQIVPKYCEGRFPGENVHTFTHLDYEHPQEMAELITWQPLTAPELA